MADGKKIFLVFIIININILTFDQILGDISLET